MRELKSLKFLQSSCCHYLLQIYCLNVGRCSTARVGDVNWVQSVPRSILNRMRVAESASVRDGGAPVDLGPSLN